jgi:hypothetical protein
MSRITKYKDDKLEFVVGDDHVLGAFIQLYDKEVDTPEGEGIVLDWSERFGMNTNYTGIPSVNNMLEVLEMVNDYIKERIEDKQFIMSNGIHTFSLN